jgi:hypothetical protein
VPLLFFLPSGMRASLRARRRPVRLCGVGAVKTLLGKGKAQ